ncbi:MAG: PEP-CTERM sorting domain-containing protein [Planctomycetota bacterium]
MRGSIAMVALGVCTIAAVAVGRVSAQELCDEATGVLDEFPGAYCFPDSPSGTPGGPIEIDVSPTTLVVPENPDGVDALTVFVQHRYPITADMEKPFHYSSTYTWESPVEADALTFREWIVTPPLSIPVTYVNAPEPDDEIDPPEFSWLLDGDGMAIGAAFEDRVIEGLPPEMPFIEQYQFQIGGLPAGAEVTFEKIVWGGGVVPEPGSLLLLGPSLGLFAFRRRLRLAGSRQG